MRWKNLFLELHGDIILKSMDLVLTENTIKIFILPVILIELGGIGNYEEELNRTIAVIAEAAAASVISKTLNVSNIEVYAVHCYNSYS